MDDPDAAAAPETPLCVTVQLKAEPVTSLFSVIAVAVPEQIVCVVGVAVTTGIGLTVTVAVIGEPVQPFAVGVIEYTAVPVAEAVADNVCAIVLPEAAVAPETPVCVTVQLNAVPVVKLDNAIDVVPPEQSVCVDGVAVANGIGFTVMTTVIGVPEQPFADGVIVYVAVPGAAPLAISDCAMLAPEPAVAPVTPVCAAVQLKVVPVTLLLKEMAVVLPEQIVCAVGVAVAAGIGFTVMVTVIGVPGQPFADGVMVYVAVPGDAPVVESVCAIELPDAAVAPVTPLCVTVQLYVVPVTAPDKAMAVAEPEQSVWDVGVAVTVGVGFTVTVTVTGVPEHPLAVGVIVYTAVPGDEPVAVSVCAIELPDAAVAPETPL